MCGSCVEEHISPGIFFFLDRGTKFPCNVCFLGKGTHITREMCCSVMCFLGREHISGLKITDSWSPVMMTSQMFFTRTNPDSGRSNNEY